MKKYLIASLFCFQLAGQSPDANQIKNLTYYVPPKASSFVTACTQAKTNNQTLAVVFSYTVVAGTYTCNLIIESPGKLIIAASASASFTGRITAPSGIQIFDTATNSSAHVLLPSPLEDIWVNWFGCDVTGGVTCTPAFNSAIYALTAGVTKPYGPTLKITAGTILLDSTVIFSSFNGLKFLGAGSATIFTWAGSSSIPMFSIQSNFGSEFSNFQILGNSIFQLNQGINSVNASGTVWVGTRNFIHDIKMEGISGYITDGMFWGGGTDSNNDQTLVQNVTISNYSHAAFYLNHTQVFNILFSHCSFAGFGWGSYGVYAFQGDFTWTNGGDSSGNAISDFFFGGRGSDNMVIEGGEYENSAAFLTTVSANVGFSGKIKDVNFAGNCLGSLQSDIKASFTGTGSCTLISGGNAVIWGYAGNFSIEGSLFGTNYVNPVTVPLTIAISDFSGSGGNNTYTVTNSVFLSSNTTYATIFTGRQPTVSNSYSFDNVQAFILLDARPNSQIFTAVDNTTRVLTETSFDGSLTSGTGAAVKAFTDSAPSTSIVFSQRNGSTYTDYALSNFGPITTNPAFNWLKPGIFASLTSCGTGAGFGAPPGSIANITDSTSITPNANAAGGGTHFAQILCTGTTGAGVWIIVAGQ